MTQAQLVQFFKENGVTPKDVANRTGYKPGYVYNVFRGYDKVSRSFCFAVLQAWPETAAFLLPARPGDNGGSEAGNG